MATEKKFSVGLINILIFILLMMASRGALALKCTNSGNGTTLFQEAITSVAVPVSSPDNSLVWRSSTQTLDVSCVEDWPAPRSTAQPVYAYFNPGKATIGGGVVIGITINGTEFPDISKVSQKWQIPGVSVSSCVRAPCAVAKFKLSYFITIRKFGNISSGNYDGSSSLDFFQLDGGGGMNANPNSNYRYRLNGLNNIHFIGCGAIINVQPTTLDFGGIPIPANAVADSNIKELDFNINVSRTCDDPFKLTALFTTTAVADNEKMKFNGMYIKIFDLTHNNYISFSSTVSDLIDFADLTGVKSVILPYKAELHWQGSQPVAGDYSTTATVTVYYN